MWVQADQWLGQFLRQLELLKLLSAAGEGQQNLRVPTISFPSPSCSTHLTPCWIHSGILLLILLVLSWSRKDSALLVSVWCLHSKGKGFVCGWAEPQCSFREAKTALVTLGGCFVTAQPQWTCVKGSWGNASGGPTVAPGKAVCRRIGIQRGQA